MNRRTIILIVGLLIVLLAGMFIYAYLKKAQLDQTAEVPEVEMETDPFVITRVDAKHFYTESEGMHTLAGEISVRTVCDLIAPTAVTVGEGSEQRVLVSFEIVNNSQGECAPATGPQRFKVGFGGPKDIRIEGYSGGKPIELNLIPAAEGESPTDFEIYMKG